MNENGNWAPILVHLFESKVLPISLILHKKNFEIELEWCNDL